MRKTARSAIFALQKHCLQSSLPDPFIDTIVHIFEHICGFTTLRETWATPIIANAVESQHQIGIHRMAFGLLSVDWNGVLSAYKVKQPQTEIELIIDTIWEDICEPL